MILDKARDLGISLSQSPEFIRMQSARALLDSSEDVSSALNEYKQKQEELLELLSTESPNRIFVASLSRDAEALRTQLLDNPIFAEVLEAQDDFEKLMSQVNKEIS
ncbi:MAG TPA: YlbF family regulator, partial [Clostridia bacterium]|nr:YlbF family regulator [Clostridia bacterium]